MLEVDGVPLTPQRFGDAVAALTSGSPSSEGPRRIHFATVHSFVSATKDQRLAELFRSARMVCTDGLPLVWLVHRRGARGAERVAGPDTMLAVLDRGRATRMRHYFLGGAPGTPELLAERMITRFPGLQVVGAFSPPFRPLALDEDQAIVDAINLAQPDALWIGLGSPKQDFWAADHEARLAVPMILAVGAAFDFHSGRLRRAPKWLQRLGLEWFFRLAMEPRRLARRYITTNAEFIWLVVRDELTRRRRYPRA